MADGVPAGSAAGTRTVRVLDALVDTNVLLDLLLAREPWLTMAHPSPIIVVQVIVTHWTKRARGEPHATLRNSVPERLSLPAQMGARRPLCVVHDVSYGEWNDFSAPISDQVLEHDHLPILLHGCGGLRIGGGELRIIFEGSYDADLAPSVLPDYGAMGMPRRAVPLRPFALRPGQWGEIRYLGRRSVGPEGLHVYRKCVYNIGWFSDWSPRVFIQTQPQRRFDSMPNVW